MSRRTLLTAAACGCLALAMGPCPGGPGFRTFDGSLNNPFQLLWGAADVPLLRLVPSDYGDGISSPAGATRPSPRAISNAVHAQTGSIPNAQGASDWVWQWGQFLDHDIDLTPGADPAEAFPIPVPLGDALFDPFFTGTETIDLNRSIWDATTGTSVDNPRQQLNRITSWIDASNVYGSDRHRADGLRTMVDGRLETSAGDLLPFNTGGLENDIGPAGGNPTQFFVAGDIRANEQAGLAATHTLFVREHNRLADALRVANPLASDEWIYQRARRFVGALIQHITYHEFLPALLGPGALAAYVGYDVGVDPSIANVFSTACFRFGHSMLSPVLQRLDASGAVIPDGNLALRDAFFDPTRITQEGGIEPLLRGLAAQAAQNVDVFIIDDVRNFLFGPPGAGGFDLASLNLQRGRDHGLPSYNDAREAFGLARKTSFADVSTDPVVQARLASVYADVDEIDAWTGGLAEDPVNGGLVGELVATVLIEQFEALRDGDRFWYERILPPAELADVQATTLADVIRRNSPIGAELQDDVFHTP